MWSYAQSFWSCCSSWDFSLPARIYSFYDFYLRSLWRVFAHWEYPAPRAAQVRGPSGFHSCALHILGVAYYRQQAQKCELWQKLLWNERHQRNMLKGQACPITALCSHSDDRRPAQRSLEELLKYLLKRRVTNTASFCFSADPGLESHVWEPHRLRWPNNDQDWNQPPAARSRQSRLCGRYLQAWDRDHGELWDTLAADTPCRDSSELRAYTCRKKPKAKS